MKTLTSRQHGLVREARNKLMSFMYLPVSANHVLYYLVEYQRTQEFIFKAIGMYLGNQYVEDEMHELALWCLYLAEDYHGWNGSEDDKLVMRKLRRIGEELMKAYLFAS